VSVQIDGIVSGLDTTALIEAMVAAYAAPIDTLNERIEGYEDKQEKISSLIDLIKDMEDILESIEDVEDFLSFTAEYPDKDADGGNQYYDVEVDGDAVAAAYSLKISKTAQAQTSIDGNSFSNPTDDASAIFGTGTLKFTVNSITRSITISAGSTLTQVASKIDDITFTSGTASTVVTTLTSYILDTGDGGPYQLVIQGDDTGVDNAVTIDDTSLSTGMALTTAVTARDASVLINGITVTDPDNILLDAVPGMTITVKESSSPTETVTVASDPDAIQEKISEFISAYNGIMSFIDTNSVYNSDADLRGPFVGESSVTRVEAGLREVIATEFTALSQTFDSLVLIGIESGSDGLLTLDTDTFEEILEEEPDQVTDLFTDADEGFITTMLDQLDLYIDSSEGSLEIRVDSIDDRIEDIEEQVERYEDRVESQIARLREQFAAMEALLGGLSASASYLTAILSE